MRRSSGWILERRTTGPVRGGLCKVARLSGSQKILGNHFCCRILSRESIKEKGVDKGRDLPYN